MPSIARQNRNFWTDVKKFYRPRGKVMDELSSLHLSSLNLIYDQIPDPLGSTDSSFPPPKQKRPPNAFLIFCMDHRSALREQHSDKPNIEISRILADVWKTMDEDARAPYKNRAEAQLQEFKQQVPEYTYEKAKQRRLNRKPGDFDRKHHFDVPDLLTLVNLPPDELRTCVAVLQSQLLMSCQPSFPQFAPDAYAHPPEEPFPHGVFRSGQ
jgi:hypothetical protein